MIHRNDDLGILTEAMAASILQKVAGVAGLDAVERVHVLYAVLDRCEDTGGRTTY